MNYHSHYGCSCHRRVFAVVNYFVTCASVITSSISFRLSVRIIVLVQRTCTSVVAHDTSRFTIVSSDVALMRVMTSCCLSCDRDNQLTNPIPEP